MDYKFTPYSITKLEKFKQCPRLFSYAYIEKAVGKQSIAGMAGSELHAKIACGIEEDLTSYALKLKKPAATYLTKKPELATGETRHDDAILYISNIPNVFILENLYLAVDKNMNSCKYEVGYLRGILDYVEVELFDVKRPDMLSSDNVKSVLVYDWKTGKNYTSGDQLRFYVYLLSRFFNISSELIIAKYVYLAKGIMMTVPTSKEDLDAVMEDIENNIKLVEEYQFKDMEKRFSPLCDYCSYCEICREEEKKDQDKKMKGISTSLEGFMEKLDSFIGANNGKDCMDS